MSMKHKEPEISGRRIGYARVSTSDQTTDQQVAALKTSGCERVYVDEGVSAMTPKREALQKALRTLRGGDVFVVWAIDRAFRSTRHAIDTLDRLNERGIHFQSITQHIDTRTPEGRKWYIDTASWAEYERAIISRRTKEKMAHCKGLGQHMGRPFALSRQKTATLYHHIQQKSMTLEQAAQSAGVSPVTLKRAITRYSLS